MLKQSVSKLSPEDMNALYSLGYRYFCEGDYKELETIDPWSGMPDTTNNVYVFTADEKEKAEAFAKTQHWVFNSSVTAKVKAIPKHTETATEYLARLDRAEAQRKATREANDKAKAEKAGMTLEEFKKERVRQANIKRAKTEIEKIEEELKYVKRKLARKKAYLKELEG